MNVGGLDPGVRYCGVAVVTDPEATYYGTVPGERTLVPEDAAMLGKIRYRDWLRQNSTGK